MRKPKVITIDSLLKRLPVIDGDILNEAINQPGLFMDAAQYHVGKYRRRVDAEALLERTRAVKALQMRSRKDESGKKSLTETAIAQHAEIHIQRLGLRKALDRAFEWEKLSSLLLTALRQRHDAIQIVERHQYSAENRSESAETRAKERKMLVSKAKELARRRIELGKDDDDDVPF